MKVAFVLLASFALAVAHVPKDRHPDPKIVGGTEATPHEFPWQAALSITKDGNSYFCGGSLVSPNYVLTAAHCLDGASEVEVQLGAHDISTVEAGSVFIVSTDLTVHESYRPNIIRNDIAVIRFPSPVSYTSNIQAIPIAGVDEMPDPGIMAEMSGWGKTSDDLFSGISDVLMKATAPTMDLDVCQSDYSAVVTTQYNICVDTAAAGNQGTCNGDSGGPLIPADRTLYNTTLHGITSYGSSAGCEEGYPAVFNRVSGYLDWIRDNTNGEVVP